MKNKYRITFFRIAGGYAAQTVINANGMDDVEKEFYKKFSKKFFEFHRATLIPSAIQKSKP